MMNFEVSNETMKELEQVAKLNNISVKKAAEIVLERYSSRYLNMTKRVIKSTENAIKKTINK